MIESCHVRFLREKRRKICILCILTITNRVTFFRAHFLHKIPQNSSFWQEKIFKNSDFPIKKIRKFKIYYHVSKNWNKTEKCSKCVKFVLFLRPNKNSRQRKVVNKTQVKIRKNPKFTWISKCIDSNIESNIQDYQNL